MVLYKEHMNRSDVIQSTKHLDRVLYKEHMNRSDVVQNTKHLDRVLFKEHMNTSDAYSIVQSINTWCSTAEHKTIALMLFKIQTI